MTTAVVYWAERSEATPERLKKDPRPWIGGTPICAGGGEAHSYFNRACTACACKVLVFVCIIVSLALVLGASWHPCKVPSICTGK